MNKEQALERCYAETPRVRRGDLELLPEEEANKIAAVAQALSDQLRLQMVHLLRQRADICTCEFEELLDLGQSKVSYHLRILLEAGIVTRETHGTWSHYSLRNSGILDRLRALVAEGVLEA